MRDLTTRQMFTTGHVADLVGVAPRTATKWIDSGIIKGHRLPGSKDRRVLRVDLVAFLVERNYGFALERIGEVLPMAA